MFRARLYSFAVLLIILAGLAWGCAGDGAGDENLPGEKQSVATAAPAAVPAPLPAAAPPAAPAAGPKSLVVGAAKSAGSASIGPDGGTLTIDEDGGKLAGLVVKVDEKAHARAVEYRVSYAPISECTYANVKPVSPLITISNGGGYAALAVDVTVPVEIGSDDFPLGFFYRGDGKALEALPLLKYDNRSVTVASCHFEPLFIGVIKTGALDGLMAGAQIDSGYRPGRDDWRFTNYGSFAKPNGHCAGMAISSIWYFLNRPDGTSTSLSARSGVGAAQRPWEEEAQGYRLASAVQADINWDNKTTEIMQELSGTNDLLTLRAFGFAMLATGEPLETGIFAKAGGGHSMVGYRIEKSALYVSDPNYPGDGQRMIRFDAATGKFIPYHSGQNADEIAKGNSTSYEQIEYTGRTAFVDFDKLGARWKDLQAGRSGNDLFPAYKVTVSAGDGTELSLAGGLTLDQSTIKVTARLADGEEAQVKAYLDGRVAPVDSDGEIELNAGRNELGLVINGKVKDSWEFIDYMRAVIVRK